MNNRKLGLALVCTAGALLIAAMGYPADPPGHRVLNVIVTDIKGDTLFYKTEEGTTRNIGVKIVEQYEKIENVRVGDPLVMEFDEGNQVIRINRPDRRTVTGAVTKFDPTERKVTLKLKDGRSETYTLIPPAATKMGTVSEGTNVVLDIDVKNNFVKDFHKE